MQSIEQLTDGAISVGPGTMYGTLKKLLRKGLIVEAAHPETQERRILYCLTVEGRALLEREIDRLQTLATIGGQKRSELRKDDD
jgi:DNA-binding PadR family transcriptional regulator